MKNTTKAKILSTAYVLGWELRSGAEKAYGIISSSDPNKPLNPALEFLRHYRENIDPLGMLIGASILAGIIALNCHRERVVDGIRGLASYLKDFPK